MALNQVKLARYGAVGLEFSSPMLAGAILGAIIVNLGKTWLTSALPAVWLFAFGGLFIAVTLCLPGGLIGLFAGRRRGAEKARGTVSERQHGPAERAPRGVVG